MVHVIVKINFDKNCFEVLLVVKLLSCPLANCVPNMTDSLEDANEEKGVSNRYAYICTEYWYIAFIKRECSWMLEAIV